MKFDVIASESHYFRHLAPIWAALPPRLQGVVHPLTQPGTVARPVMGHIALVAAWQDVQPLRGTCQMVYVEHGAGQVYTDRLHDPSYSGSQGARHTGVVGYIAPSQTVADRWTQARAVAVGCPKMDHWLNTAYVPGHDPVVCFVFHWPCNFTPETRSAWEHYQPRFTEIVDRYVRQGFHVAAHAHPKWRGQLDPLLAAAGARVWKGEDQVFRHADIVIVDNSSLGMEFMSLRRPVVWMNAPWYRRDVFHGGRFWDWTADVPTVDDAEELMGLDLYELLDPNYDLTFQDRHVANTYAYTDGHSAERASEWLTQLVDA